MKVDLSPAAEKALLVARIDSVVEELDLVVLLTHLVADDEFRPAEILMEHGCQLEELRLQLTKFSPRTTYQRKFLTHARETTTDHGESTITGEYLLLTLLSQDAELRNLVLRTGAKLDRLVQSSAVKEIQTIEPVPKKIVDVLEPAQRITDVNSNRIREALRVLDDYTRFVRNDPINTESLKNLRHDFVTVLREHPSLIYLESRDTVGDVGTSISTAGEHQRTDVHAVAKVNMKRLQEALRSLEEFGKVLDPLSAAKIEQLRYRSYTLERNLFVLSPSRDKLAKAQLYLLISSDMTKLDLEVVVRQAIRGGVSVVQLREKQTEDRQFLELAKQLRTITRELGTLFIINDRPDICKIVGADGVHLGQDDLPIHDVRKILAPEQLIGISTHEPSHLHQAIRDGADYLGVGPMFESQTKQFTEFAGIEYLRYAANNCPIPFFAIGGINQNNVSTILSNGGTRVAVSSVISRSENPEQEANSLLRSLRL